MMRVRHASIALLFAIVGLPAIGAAQDLTPRAYFPAPVSSNVLIFTYAYSVGELVFDPTLPITDATGTIHTPVISAYHAFDLFGRSASITGTMPFAIGDLSGTVSGEERSVTRRGVADAVVRLAVNIVGGPALPLSEFAKTPVSRNLLGASLKVVAPTGEYDPTRLVNIGTNRWAFKPEVGYTGRTGKFVIDAFAGIWLFTANDSFQVSDANPRGFTRTQDPIGALEFHVSYDVKPRLWISADINYWHGGRTTVNGVKGSLTLQANSRFGVTGSVPLSRRHSIKVSYSDGVIVRVGGNFRVLSAGWQYGWVGRRF
jgi:hypothetical protein